ncbi:hypothetical protein Pan216_14400 [Planctomycetes bacterium Pan216]|uniref:Uncharacterized protein n=1 Tax=Kolteria novifilia TaxID=2527975 RepID=A0A518B0T7_9BACT|nr:hypothetical protein Pan216_14400 [Planctomycetes bacterium Pan216]
MTNDSNELDPELHDVEAALAVLRPDAASLDHGLLMYRAGEIAGERSAPTHPSFGWPVAFTAMSSVAAVLLVMLLQGPRTVIETRIVEVEVPVPASTPTSVIARTADDSSANEWPRANLPSPLPFETRAEYLASIERHFTLGVDPWASTIPKNDESIAAEGSAPTYFEMLDGLLKEGG